MGRYDKSSAFHEDACHYLPGGVSSNFRYQTTPLCFERGEGCYLWDLDGNRYIDYVLGNGPAILGHTPTSVLEAVRSTLGKGQAFTAVHPSELALAKRLTEIIPCAEQVRFDVSGTQGDQIAMRLARAHTGRDKVVKFEGQYHGWADNILMSVHPALNEAGPHEKPMTLAESRGQAEGVINNVITQPFNDIDVLTETLDRHREQVAAILMEPIACNTGVIEPKSGYLEAVRALCDRHGIVLIYDEVITGFRASLGGAQALYGVTPDIAVFAKAVAAGFPMCIVAGSRQIMQGMLEGVVHGGTYNGLTSSVAACAATVKELAHDNAAVYARMIAQGQRLVRELNELGKKHALPLHAQGIGSIFCTVFTDSPPLRDYRDYKASDGAMRLRFVEELQHRGVRTTERGTWFLSSVLSDADVTATLEAADEALRAMKT